MFDDDMTHIPASLNPVQIYIRRSLNRLRCHHTALLSSDRYPSYSTSIFGLHNIFSNFSPYTPHRCLWVVLFYLSQWFYCRRIYHKARCGVKITYVACKSSLLGNVTSQIRRYSRSGARWSLIARMFWGYRQA